MRYYATKRVEISAAHSLPEFGEQHRCSRMHGHNYVVEVECSASALDSRGCVVDFDKVEALIRMYDHKVLNEVFQPATAERFAAHIWDGVEFALSGRGELVRVDEVTVYEDGNTFARLNRSR